VGEEKNGVVNRLLPIAKTGKVGRRSVFFLLLLDPDSEAGGEGRRHDKCGTKTRIANSNRPVVRRARAVGGKRRHWLFRRRTRHLPDDWKGGGEQRASARAGQSGDRCNGADNVVHSHA